MERADRRQTGGGREVDGLQKKGGRVDGQTWRKKKGQSYKHRRGEDMRSGCGLGFTSRQTDKRVGREFQRHPHLVGTQEDHVSQFSMKTKLSSLKW